MKFLYLHQPLMPSAVFNEVVLDGTHNGDFQTGFGYYRALGVTGDRYGTIVWHQPLMPTGAFNEIVLDGTHNGDWQTGFGYYRVFGAGDFAVGVSRTTTESLVATAVATRGLILLRSAAESLATADLARASSIRFVTDSLSTSPSMGPETVTRILSALRSTTETLSISDAARALGSFKANENLLISESADRAQTKTGVAVDHLTIGQVVSTTKGSVRGATDHLSVSVTVVASGGAVEWEYLLDLESPDGNLPLTSGGLHYLHTW